MRLSHKKLKNFAKHLVVSKKHHTFALAKQQEQQTMVR
jgi:hypothetical protein